MVPDNIISLLITAGRVIKDRLREANGVSPTQIWTLRFISERGEPTMKDVADYLSITPPSATAVIENFVEQNLIERILDKQDRRIIRLRLTSKGKMFLDEVSKKASKKMKDLLSKLDKNEINQLKIILEKISR